MNKVDVWIGVHAEYAIPEEVSAKARALNAGKSLQDRRTKGFKYLAWWGRCQDADYESVIAIEKHYGLKPN